MTGRSRLLRSGLFRHHFQAGPASTLYAIERAAREHDYLVNIASSATMTRKSIRPAGALTGRASSRSTV